MELRKVIVFDWDTETKHSDISFSLFPYNIRNQECKIYNFPWEQKG